MTRQRRFFAANEDRTSLNASLNERDESVELDVVAEDTLEMASPCDQ